MTPYPITAHAIANCLGNERGRVVENALEGADTFSSSDDFLPGSLPFRVPVGLMRELAPRGDAEAWTSAETRVFQVAFASARQMKAPVARAVQRWGTGRVSYVFASSTGGLEHTERAVARGDAIQHSADARRQLLRDHAMDATNADIARYLGIGGYRYVVTTACSSGLKALKSAVRMLATNLADAVVVGCADTLCRTTLFGFRSLGILPDQPTRPFSQLRAGLTLGEGSAYVLLERSCEPGQALAWLRGLGESADAFHPSSPHPEGLGALASMREALATAGVTTKEVDHVSAHATGSLQNDAMESLAIGALFPGVPVTATKSLTGHTLGAAGLTSLVLATESMRLGRLMPTLRSTPRDPAIPLQIVEAPAPHRIDHVLVNAFAFGGNCTSALLSTERGRS